MQGKSPDSLRDDLDFLSPRGDELFQGLHITWQLITSWRGEQHWLLVQDRFCGEGANQLHSLNALMPQECLIAGSKSPKNST